MMTLKLWIAKVLWSIGSKCFEWGARISGGTMELTRTSPDGVEDTKVVNK